MVLPYFRAAPLTQKDTSTVFTYTYKQYLKILPSSHNPEGIPQRLWREGKQKLLICTIHSAPLIKGDSQLVCTYFLEIFGAFQPSQPTDTFSHREVFAEPCRQAVLALQSAHTTPTALWLVCTMWQVHTAYPEKNNTTNKTPLSKIPHSLSIDYRYLPSSNFQELLEKQESLCTYMPYNIIWRKFLFK